MFAIAFDLNTKELEKHYVPPKSWRNAYADVQGVLEKYGFLSIQGSVYLNEEDDMTLVFRAIQALKSIPWFPLCVTDIRAFKVENWSNFTDIVKGTAT